MTKLKLLFASSLICLATSSCATVDIPDLNPGVTLPYFKEGYRYTTLSNVETTVPAAEWNMIVARSIVLTAEDWQKLKFVLLKNCLTNKCKATAGALDSLFYAIDDALKQLPSK